MSDLEKRFYQEIIDRIKDFVDLCISSISNKDGDLAHTSEEESYRILQGTNFSKKQLEALNKVIREVCRGIIHSTFVSIDGGTALSDHGKALELIDRKHNKPLTKTALHENFIEFVVKDKP